MLGKVSYFKFDHHFVLTDEKFLGDLAAFYCNLWRFDPNFAEYKKCPNCEVYYSYNFVEVQNNTDCPNCNVPLVEAWVEECVQKTIISLASLGEDFYGAVAQDETTNKIVGFVWGVNRSFESMAKRDEPENILDFVNNPTGKVPYFNEIATDPAYREQGVGSKLCFMLVEWMKENFPNVPGYLHTHQDSPARRLFEKAGYVFHSCDEKLGGGRIYMAIDSCSNFTPEKLRR